MIETYLLVSPDTHEESGERVYDKALRPTSLEEFVGQVYTILPAYVPL